MDCQGELFTLPELQRPPPKLAAPPAAPKLVPYQGSHTLCDECVLAIHMLGQQGAPYPMPARWRYSQPDGTVKLLCHRHGQDVGRPRRPGKGV